MKRLIFVCSLLVFQTAFSQSSVYPKPAQAIDVLISGGRIHIGNGTVMEKGDILLSNGKIKGISETISAPANAQVIDASGKEIYPALILPMSSLGLVEVSTNRPMTDSRELGLLNPNVRAIVAYNTDSRIINTLRSNGIGLAQIVPEGDLLGGSSSVVQLDAWNWEDAAYNLDGGFYVHMPYLEKGSKAREKGKENLELLKSFFADAKAYLELENPSSVNLKLAAVKGLFTGEKRLFVTANSVTEILTAIDFKKEFGIEVVICGASGCEPIINLLAKEKIPVIIGEPHSLPNLTDDAVDAPYALAAKLKKAGVLFAINDDSQMSRGRNLPFVAGTCVGYGLSKEDALQAITLNTAKILKIDKTTGSIETGKDANVILVEGDLLDARKSNVQAVFIQGRQVDLQNVQTQLYDRYKVKYGL